MIAFSRTANAPPGPTVPFSRKALWSAPCPHGAFRGGDATRENRQPRRVTFQDSNRLPPLPKAARGRAALQRGYASRYEESTGKREGKRTLNAQHPTLNTQLPQTASHQPTTNNQQPITNNRPRRAFTLIEIVASLAMIAVLSALMLPFLSGTSVNATIGNSAQLTAAYALRTEMETWIHLARTTYADQFDALPTLIDSYFQNVADIGIVESDWVEFTETAPGSGIFTETDSATQPSDHLRLTLQHVSGHKLTYLFSRPPE